MGAIKSHIIECTQNVSSEQVSEQFIVIKSNPNDPALI